MAGEVFNGTIALQLKKTLSYICTDETENIQSKMDYKHWMYDRPMTDAYEDDQEYAGSGLLAEIAEGAELVPLTIYEGYTKRYTARKIGGKYGITEEALHDSKYPKVIQAVKRLNRAGWFTVDIDATNQLVRATNAAFPGPDGVALAANNHPLAGGGTFSNLLATPAAPSTASWNAAIAQCDQLVSNDGLVEGIKAKGVVHPVQQRGIWTVLLKSSMDPAAGNFSAVNIIKHYDNEIKRIPLKHWSNTETNWALLTDCEKGFQIRWLRKFKSNTWVDHNNEVMYYSLSGRYDVGTSDARCMIFSDS